jgi:hypothetical protein
MNEASPGFVQNLLLELAQQVMYVIEVSNAEQQILEEVFQIVQNRINILQTRL